MILSSIAPGYAREEQGLSRNFRMDPPASPARWDWAIQPRHRPKSSNMTDIDWHPNSSNIFQQPISQTTVWMYDSYTSFAWLCCVLVSWMAVTLIVVWPTWVFESQTVRTIVVRQDPGCMQHADLRLATWDNLSNDQLANGGLFGFGWSTESVFTLRMFA